MFSRKKDSKNLSSSYSNENFNKKNKEVYFSLLGNQTYFQGKVILKGEARLAGHVEGTIISENLLIIEESAIIKGEIHGVNVEISGIFEGTLNVSESLRLTPSARVDGEISAVKLIVEEGARLCGKLSYLEVRQPKSEELQLQSLTQ